MTPWSLTEILQVGALIPSSGILLAPSMDASGASEGNLDGNDEAGLRPQTPKFCSVSTVAGKKCDCEPMSSKKRSYPSNVDCGFEVTGKGAVVTGKGAEVMGNAADVTAKGAVVTGNDAEYTADSVSRPRSPYDGMPSTRPRFAWAWLISDIKGCSEFTSSAEARCVAASDKRSKLHAAAGLGAIRESGGNVDTTADIVLSLANCDWVGDCCTPSISESPWLLVGLACMFAADDFLRVLGMTLSFVPSLRCTSFSWRTSRSLMSM